MGNLREKVAKNCVQAVYTKMERAQGCETGEEERAAGPRASI